MRIKHYGLFYSNIESLSHPKSWETLRNNSNEASFYLPYNKEDYIKKVDTNEPNIYVKTIIEVAKANGLNKIFSIGSGVAHNEYQIKKFSSLEVHVSDYNDSITRLNDFKIFDFCTKIDALKENLPIDKDYLVIFPRIDTEFEDEQLETLLMKCSDSGVRWIVFIPAQLLNFRIAANEGRVLLKSIVVRKKRTFCGYSRTKRRFNKIFNKYYSIDSVLNGGTKFFVLKKKNA